MFVLSKTDLHETIVDYPDAQRALKRKATYAELINKLIVELSNFREIMKKSQKREDDKNDIESSKAKIERASELEVKLKTPMFLKTVLQVPQ